MPEPNITTLPLLDKHVLVTRTREQASVLSAQLREQGAIPIEFPTIRIVPPQDWSQLDAALSRLYEPHEGTQPFYSWLVLTSANGVTICCERLRTLGYDPSALQNVRVAAIGPATAAALEQYGITADLVPDEYIAEGMAAALIEDAHKQAIPLTGQHILLARAAEARKVLVTTLQQEGAQVDVVAAYYTHTVARNDEHGRAIVEMLRHQQLDILTFTSSSTVRNFSTWLQSFLQDETLLTQETLLAYPKLACIGPITAQTARDLGLRVDIEAEEFTIEGLVQALVHYKEIK